MRLSASPQPLSGADEIADPFDAHFPSGPIASLLLQGVLLMPIGLFDWRAPARLARRDPLAADILAILSSADLAERAQRLCELLDERHLLRAAIDPCKALRSLAKSVRKRPELLSVEVLGLLSDRATDFVIAALSYCARFERLVYSPLNGGERADIVALLAGPFRDLDAVVLFRAVNRFLAGVREVQDLPRCVAFTPV